MAFQDLPDRALSPPLQCFLLHLRHEAGEVSVIVPRLRVPVKMAILRPRLQRQQRAFQDVRLTRVHADGIKPRFTDGPTVDGNFYLGRRAGVWFSVAAFALDGKDALSQPGAALLIDTLRLMAAGVYEGQRDGQPASAFEFVNVVDHIIQPEPAFVIVRVAHDNALLDPPAFAVVPPANHLILQTVVLGIHTAGQN